MTGAPPFLSRRERALPPWGLCLGSWMSLVCGEFKKPVVWYCLVMGHISAWMGLEGTLRPQGGVGGSWVATGGRVRPGGDKRRGGMGSGKNPGPKFPAWPTLQPCLPSRETGAPRGQQGRGSWGGPEALSGRALGPPVLPPPFPAL